MNKSRFNRTKSATPTRESFIWWTITRISYNDSPLARFLSLIASIFRNSSKGSNCTPLFTNEAVSISSMRRSERIAFENNLEIHLSYLQMIEQKKQNHRSIPLNDRELKEIAEETFLEAYRLIPTSALLEIESQLNERGIITARQNYNLSDLGLNDHRAY